MYLAPPGQRQARVIAVICVHLSLVPDKGHGQVRVTGQPLGVDF
jgi:hypothetical protein